jgi:hypothetical protein
MTMQRRQFGLPLVLLTSSAHALYPSMTLEKSKQRYAVVSIKADGQAFHFGKCKNKPGNAFSSTTLIMYGSVHLGGNGALKLDDLVGCLQIGLSDYAITSGSGEANKKGKIEINAKTTDAGKALELILHGSTDGDAVVFDRKESRLSSLYLLSLKGQAVITMPTTSTSSTENDDDG